MKKPVRTLAALPTLVTLGNAFCGFLAVTYVIEAVAAHTVDDVAGFYRYLELAVFSMFMGMIFDFLDGKVARLTGSASLFGVQLDSLSDVVSFGLVPAVLCKTLMQYDFVNAEGIAIYRPKTALIISSFYMFGAVLRLARFNVETDLEEDDHRTFRGLPSPSAAAGVASVVFLYSTREFPALDPWIVRGFPFLVVLMGVLMWTKLPYIHFANTVLTERRQTSHFLIVLIAIGVVFWEPAIGISVLVLGYALSGPILYVWNLCTGRSTVEGESLL